MFLVVVTAFLVGLVVASLVVTWKMYISKPKQAKENNSVSSPRISRAEVRAWLVELLARGRGGEVVTDGTQMTQAEFVVALLLAKEKYGLSIEKRDGVFHLVFENGSTFEFNVNAPSIKTVRDFVEMLDKHLTRHQR